MAQLTECWLTCVNLWVYSQAGHKLRHDCNPSTGVVDALSAVQDHSQLHSESMASQRRTILCLCKQFWAEVLDQLMITSYRHDFNLQYHVKDSMVVHTCNICHEETEKEGFQ